MSDNKCPSCGGVLGIDCFNPIECAAITHMMQREMDCHPDNDELDHLRAENQRLREENKFMKSRYHIASAKMDGKHTWIALNHWPQIIGTNIDAAVARAVEVWRDECDTEKHGPGGEE